MVVWLHLFTLNWFCTNLTSAKVSWCSEYPLCCWPCVVLLLELWWQPGYSNCSPDVGWDNPSSPPQLQKDNNSQTNKLNALLVILEYLISWSHHYLILPSFPSYVIILPYGWLLFKLRAKPRFLFSFKWYSFSWEFRKNMNLRCLSLKSYTVY